MSLKKNWIISPRFDLTFIIAPHFLSALFVFFIQKTESASLKTLPIWAWILGVLLVDVAHVYSTLFRTYFHSEARKKWSFLLFIIPITVFFTLFFIHKIGATLFFWRILAYIAAFHFIRQQYGFYKIYDRKFNAPNFKKRIDEVFLYSLMLCPLLYWHTHLPRNFEWFLVGDFIGLNKHLWTVGLCLQAFITFVYFGSEVYFFRNYFNIQKNTLFAATATSWMVGIIYFNSDFSFTLTNTLSHGIPYIALVIGTTYLQKPKKQSGTFMNKNYIISSTCFVLITIFILAYLEEGLWDALFWHEREILFRPFSIMNTLANTLGESFWIAILSVPQVTHYFLDAFIWKLRDPPKDFAQTINKN